MAIKNLKPTDKKCYLREANGFTIRVMPSGVKTWLFVYTFDGKRKEMNLGQYPHVSLADARTKFNQAYDLHKNGKDPADIDRQKKEARRKAPTVAELVDEYIKKHAKVSKKSWEADERLLNKEIVPLWGKRKAQDITKRDATLLLESIIERGAPGMSNQVLKITRKMFNFAVERDILQHSPFTAVKALAPNNSRDRTLSESEIKTLWESMNSAAMSDEIRRALKLVLVTAQRPGEVAGMHTCEIDGKWWTIPAERSKNGKEHRVFLSDLAQLIITDSIENAKTTRENAEIRNAKEMKRAVLLTPEGQEYTGYIFPCSRRFEGESKGRVKAPEAPIDSHALPVAVRRNLVWPLTDKKGKPLYDKEGKPATENRLGVEKFTPHDLRRSAATFMAGMGFMDEVIDAVLNHVKQGIIRTYNRHGYDKEKQQALEAWERKLTSIITGEKAKVIPITRANNNE